MNNIYLFFFRPDILESPFVLEKKKWNDAVYQQVLKNKKYVFHYGRLGYFKGTYLVAETVYLFFFIYLSNFFGYINTFFQIHQSFSYILMKPSVSQAQYSSSFTERCL